MHDVVNSHAISWRFSSYEIRALTIGPARGAQLEQYDPWAHYQTDRAHRVGTPPYAELANVVRELPSPGRLARGVQIEPDAREALLKWCASHGLLGLIHHRVLAVVSGDQRIARVAVRGPSGWQTSARVSIPTQEIEETLGEKVASREPTRAWLPHEFPGALVRPIGKPAGLPTWVPEEEALKPFFPTSKPGQYPFPPKKPGSPRFWKSYREPLVEFVAAARRLTHAVEELVETADKSQRLGEADRIPRDRALQTLNSLTEVATPVLAQSEDGYYQERWSSLSSLGTLARMAILDLLGEEFIRSCEKCGRMFRAGDQALYCSDRCRWAVQQARHRVRKKARKVPEVQPSAQSELPRRASGQLEG